MEVTEKKFKQWCNSKGYFCKKFLTHTVCGKGGAQESDFLICTEDKVCLLECKQRNGNLFRFDDLTQELKLDYTIKKTKLLYPYILINFIEYNILVLFKYNEYKEIKEIYYPKRKSLNIKMIPDKFKYNWKTLEIK